MKIRSQPPSRYDQNLVADQPGRPIFFSGLFFALIVGLLFRGMATPQRIEALVNEAASKIHNEVKADFDSAYVSLSDRGLPRFAVVISKVRMTSENTCWGRPALTAEQIVLPVSLVSLVFERQPFRKILAEDVDLHIRSPRTNCETVEAPVATEVKPAPAVTIVNRKRIAPTNAETSLDRLEINRLKLQYDPQPLHSFEVVDLNLQVRSHQTKHVTLEAKTHLLRDQNLHDYVSHGEIVVDYKEAPAHEVQVQLFGNWREGNYNIGSSYQFDTGTVNSSIELKHIPAAQVITALKNYGWLRDDLDGRKIWVTLKAQSEGNLKEWEKLPLTINGVHVEGDLGEVTVEAFHASQLKPFQFKPVRTQVRSLNVDRLLEFMRRPHTLNFIGRYGEFNGRFDLINDNEFKLTGTHSGLEFIFSNRGQRELQRVSSLEGELGMRDQKWDLKLNSVKLEQGEFDGDIDLIADREFKEISVKMNANEMILADNVQRLMTGGGKIGPVKSEVAVKILQGQVKDLKGYIRSPEMVIDRVRFDKFNTQFDMVKEQLNVQVQAQEVEVPPEALGFTMLNQVLASNEKEPVKLAQVGGRFEVAATKELKWKNLVAQPVGLNGRLVSDGGWSSTGDLTGEILSKTNKNSQRWYLTGHRDQPILTKNK